VPILSDQRTAADLCVRHQSAQALAAKVRLIVWCKGCGHQAEPDVATQVAHHGSTMPVPDGARFLRCSIRGEREADFVVSGEAP
jgi:hypothetical protein